MNISIKATHVDLTPSIKEYVEEKVGSLDKFTGVTEAHVELKRDKHHNSGLVFGADIKLLFHGQSLYAEIWADDAYAAVDLLIPKIKEQITKFKDKKSSINRSEARAAKEME